MKKTVITVVVIVLAVIMAMPVAAQMRMRGGYGRGYYQPADLTKLAGLNLTDDQSMKIKTLRENHLLDIKPTMDRMHRKALELKDLWLVQSPDTNKMGSVQREIKIFRQELYEKAAAYRHEILSVLTYRQQTVLLSYREKHNCDFDPLIQMRKPGGRSDLKNPGKRNHVEEMHEENKTRD